MRARSLTRLVGLTAAAAVAAAVTVLPATALGAVSGTTTLRLDGPAAAALRASGVRISPLAPARGGPNRVVLPVRSGLAGQTTTLMRQRGGLRFERGSRTVKFGGLALTLGKRSSVQAQAGRTKLELFRVTGAAGRKVDALAGSVSATGLQLQLSAAAARLLVARLDLDGLRQRKFGSLATRAKGLTPGGVPEEKGGGGVAAAGCPLPSGAGHEPESPLPTLVRPVGAVDVLSATIDWHARESFIRYVATGEGTSVSGGATADPPVVAPGTSTALSYGFHFPFASGWLSRGANVADPADDTALLAYSGAVRFHYSAHEIDLSTASPEIELNGAKSRAIFNVTDGAKAPARQVLVNLDLAKAAKITAAGNSYTYERVPGAIPSGTATTTFAGFYSPGTEFGCFTVSFTTAG